jgi:N-carbamoyl-L-amino-acid hydrolase
VTRALAENVFARLRQVTGDGVGITRDSYSTGEGAARAHGLKRTRDQAANLVVTWPGIAGGHPASSRTTKCPG